MKRVALVALIVAGMAGTSFAQFVVPNATESATSSGLNTPLRNAARAWEGYYATINNTLTSPFTITGMQFRLAIDNNWRPAGFVPNTWPTQNITFSDYRVELSKASAGLVSDGEYLSLTPTFASYQVSPVVVRTGPLTIPANSFDGTGLGVHPWGPVITFTNSYTINPGENLVVLIRLPGYTPAAEPQAFFSSKSFQNGFEDAISSTASSTAAAPNGFSSPLFIRFVPEPTTIGLLGVGLLGLIRRKR